MTKTEVIDKMMNSENGGLYAAIGGIVVVYGIDRITRSRHKVEAGKETFKMGPSMEPTGAPVKEQQSEEKPAEK